MLTEDEKNWIKQSFINIATDHKHNCDGQLLCEVRLLPLLVALKELNIPVAPEEMGIFV